MPDHLLSGPLPEHASRAVEAVESVSDGVLTVDLNSNVVYMNPAAVRLTGWSLQDALGKPALQVFHAVIGDTGTTLAVPLGCQSRRTGREDGDQRPDRDS